MSIDNETWEVGGNLGRPCKVVDSTGKLVCNCRDAETAQAIARLPGLLKAAKDACEMLGYLHPVRGVLRDALKAMQPPPPDEFVYLELNADNWKDWHGRVIEVLALAKWKPAVLEGFGPLNATPFVARPLMCNAGWFERARVKFRRLRVGEKLQAGDRMAGRDTAFFEIAASRIMGEVGTCTDYRFLRYVEPS